MASVANIADHLPRLAASQPDAIAVQVPHLDVRISYRELDQRSSTIARGLAANGTGKGSRVVLMVPPGADFHALAFALLRLGAVLVAVDPGIGRENLKQCLAEAAPQAFIGTPLALLARRLLGWGNASVKENISTGFAVPALATLSLKEIEAEGAVSKLSLPPTEADDMAAILFTSGSTGVPKGVVYTHAKFVAQVEALRSLFDIRPGETDLATFPLFGLFAPALGMCSVVPKMDFTRPGRVNAERLLTTRRDSEADSMFGSPALLQRVSGWAHHNGQRLDGLRRIISAGAPVAPEVLRQCQGLLDEGAAIHTPYGATEALPVACIDSQTILNETAALTAQGHGVCVGMPVPNLQLAIIPISDEVIPEWDDTLALPQGEIGEIVVRGPQVTEAYFNRDEATRRAKIRHSDGSIWHRMGDAGYLDERGRLWFCGRVVHRVDTAAGTLFSVNVEGVFNPHPEVLRTALVGIGKAGQQQPVLCVETRQKTSPVQQARIRTELLVLGSQQHLTRDITEIRFHAGFPVDIRHNAKINREQLARWVGEQAA